MKNLKKLFLLLFLFLFTNFSFSQIILIQGTPRTGKTSLAKKLELSFKKYSKRFSVDDYPKSEILYKSIYSCLKKGRLAICDTNASPKLFSNYKRSFGYQTPIFSILLFCPPFELFKRTIESNKKIRKKGIEKERDICVVMRYFVQLYECTAEKTSETLCFFSFKDLEKISKEFANEENKEQMELAIKILNDWAFRKSKKVCIEPILLNEPYLISKYDLIIDTSNVNKEKCEKYTKIYYSKWQELLEQKGNKWK